MKTKKNIYARWRFVSTNTLRSYFDLGKSLEAELRRELPSPLYWIQPNRKILWNLPLVQDYLLNGNSPQHQRLVEQYLSTLAMERAS
ncbi:hypothetical protein [Pseudanabaena sp. PCC 6802]|uniref:hypothetical protein n=1 Tax=Pseudanabaena sp. PCC 6802 TaxID=118173 RepID=UPI00034B7EE3|nr:hypothetical protein [Pseudanabaena sp. PCC 6802]